jgi:hypothetical protein
MSIHGHRVFVNWIDSVLTAGGLTVGLGVAPDSAPIGSGFAVIHSIAGGVTRGTLEAPRSDGEPNVQVTSVGSSEEQALWMADKVRSLLDAAVPATLSDGRHVVWLDFPMSSVTVLRDDDVQPPIWTAPDRFVMGTVPT